MYSTFAWAKTGPDTPGFKQMEIRRNMAGEEDVTFTVKYCGVCRFDVHSCDNEMGDTHYPCVPGHEVAGVVTIVGRRVEQFKVRRTIQNFKALKGEGNRLQKQKYNVYLS